MAKRIYFIGGTSDFSSQVVTQLEGLGSYQITAVGRRTGHKVSKDSEGLKRICSEFNDYDAVVNFTYAGGAQYDLMIELYKHMVKSQWQGHFINFGSTIVLHHSTSMKAVMDSWDVFRIQGIKKAVQYLGHEWSRRFHANSFRYTALQCGMLDNDKMRSLPNYRPTCLKPEDLVRLLDFCLSSPPHWHLHEILLDGM